MPQPTPPVSPDPADATPEASAEPAGPADVDASGPEPEAPLNRAARRARTKSGDPSHVGPSAGRSHQGRGPRSHTKRQV